MSARYIDKSLSGEGNEEGTIFYIQRFSLHDGPGIRTTVFLKGCPLRCWWCSNPESQNPFPEIMTYDIKCIGCKKCGEACPEGAITFAGNIRKIDRAKCTLCGKCAGVCPSGAIQLVGRYITAREVIEEVNKDTLFYSNSGGGVTISGGEPLLQGRFTAKIISECKKKAIHTVLDTSGYGEWDLLEEILDNLDLLLYDIKHLDSHMHKAGTGTSNELIIKNAGKIAGRVKIWMRVPVIPGYNDEKPHLKELAEFALRMKCEKVSLLPYHEWGKAKYEKLGREYCSGSDLIPRENYLQDIKKGMESIGLKVAIGN